MFNLDTRSTSVSQSLRLLSSPLFKYASIFAQIFFFAFVISFVGFIFSIVSPVFWFFSLKFPLLFLLLYLFFLEVDFFAALRLRDPEVAVALADVVSQENYNMAEVLSLESCQIVEHSQLLAKKMKLPQVTSELLLYAAMKKSKDMPILIFRLGLDVKKIETDLNSALENQKGGAQQGESLFSDSFQKTMHEALNIAYTRRHRTLNEKDILVGLAKEDEFFKNVLLEHDLKEQDVEELTLWFDTFETTIAAQRKFWTKENLFKAGSVGKDFAAGYTVMLDQVSIDWRTIAHKRYFTEVIGRKKFVDETEIILTKSNFSNVLLVGDPGVGKKSIIKALAERCYLGTGLSELANKRVVELNMVSLVSQIVDRDQLASVLDQIFQEVLSAGNVILVIDQLEKFVESKVQKPGVVDISAIVSKYLAMQSFKFIGITSFDGLHRKLEKTPGLLEYFRKIEIPEMSMPDTISVLQNLALWMEQKNKILIIYPSIREIVHLADRYLPNIPFPKKAIDILDEAFAYVKSLRENVILTSHIATIMSQKTQIPVGKVETKEKSVLINLEKLMHERIVGQPEAVKEISVAMRRARSGIESSKRPMGTFLFLGPTGVGKTETAKALSDIYFGGQLIQDVNDEGTTKKKMIRLDMSEFQSLEDIPRLIGSVSPVEQEGLLTTPVRDNPFSLVLMDEIEKAHLNILNLFLQVFDEGYVTDGQGRKVAFTDTIIICTSNAGADLIFKALESKTEVDKDKLVDTLFEKGIFRPEFVNRFDATVIFHPLTKENLISIAQLILTSLAKKIKEKDIDFVITEPLKEKIVELSYKPQFGAREMRRVIQDNIENKIAAALLEDQVKKGDMIEIDPETFAVRIVK